MSTRKLTVSQLIEMLSQQQPEQVVFVEVPSGASLAVLGMAWSDEQPERITLVAEGGPHDRLAQEAELLRWKYRMNAAMAASKLPPLESALIWEDETAEPSSAGSASQTKAVPDGKESV